MTDIVAAALALALLALLLELALGYPDRLFRLIGHPVTWAGRLIDLLDRRLNRPGLPPRVLRRRGGAALLALLAAALLVALPLHVLALAGPAGLLIASLLLSSLFAQRSLHAHVAAVADALDASGLAAGRAAVAHIVGRDPDRLDEAGVARAAIESLAENFSDGVVAPAFWLGLAGPAGALAYKAVNTADSMIGHMNERHRDFGRAAARLDDLVNLPASRLSAFLIVAAAALLPGASPAAAWRAIRQDARHHRSPNAGWPEAAMAGALGIALAGPRHYGGVLTTDRAMNAGGRRDLDAADIRRALRLYRVADALLILLAFALLALVISA
jgi:adenosylcobinamide-phosphate synthase